MVAVGVVELVGEVTVASLGELTADGAHFLILLASIPIIEHEFVGAFVEEVVAYHAFGA